MDGNSSYVPGNSSIEYVDGVGWQITFSDRQPVTCETEDEARDIVRAPALRQSVIDGARGDELASHLERTAVTLRKYEVSDSLVSLCEDAAQTARS
jgi:hypothetical protein